MCVWVNNLLPVKQVLFCNYEISQSFYNLPPERAVDANMMHICRKNIPNCTDFSFTLIFTDLAVKGIFHLKKHRLNLIFLILKGYGIAHFDQIVHNPLNIEFFVWNYVPKDLESRLHKGPWFAASGTLTGGSMGRELSSLILPAQSRSHVKLRFKVPGNK